MTTSSLRCLPLIVLLLPARGASADDVSSSLVVADKWGACVMLGYHVRGAFAAAAELSSSSPERYQLAARAVLQTYRSGDILTGTDNRNRHARVVIKGINADPVLGESSLELETANWREGVVALLSRPQLPIRLLRPAKARLPKDIDNRLRSEIDVLFKKHLLERALDERPSVLHIREPIVESLNEAPGLFVVKYPLVLIGNEGSHDDRAQVFFLFSISTKKILRADFGHGEWAPVSSALTIWPEMYFRVAGANQILFVGLHQGGWEDASGRALYDLRTGREILFCY